MPLSSAFNPNKPPNIKDVTWTPEKKSGKIFDPERDITEEDWKGMLELFNQERMTDDGRPYFVRNVFQLIQLFPDKHVNFYLSSEDIETIIDHLNDPTAYFPNGVNSDLRLAVNLIREKPELKKDLLLENDSFQRSFDGLKNARENGLSQVIFRNAALLLQLYPEREAEITPTDAEYEKAKEELSALRASADWMSFASLAANISVVFPQKRKELELTEDDLKKILADCVEVRELNFYNYALELYDLYILTADEIKRKEDGTLEIIFNKPKQTELKEETPPLPVTRNY